MPSPTLFSGEKATGPLPSSPFAFVLPPAEPVPDDGAPKDFAALLALELAHHAESLGLGDAFNAANEGGEGPAGKAAEAAPKQSLQLFPSFAESAASQLNESANAHAPTGEAVASASSPEAATDVALESEENAQEDIDEFDMAVAPFMLAVDAQPMLQWKPRQTGKLSATYQELVKPASEATALTLTNEEMAGATNGTTNVQGLSQPEQTVSRFDAPSFSPNFVPRTLADLPSSSLPESLSETAANLSSNSSGTFTEGMSDAEERQIRITAPLSSAGQQLLEDARRAFEEKQSTEKMSQTAPLKLPAESTPQNELAQSVMPLLTPVNEPAAPEILPTMLNAQAPRVLPPAAQKTETLNNAESDLSAPAAFSKEAAEASHTTQSSADNKALPQSTDALPKQRQETENALASAPNVTASAEASLARTAAPEQPLTQVEMLAEPAAPSIATTAEIEMSSNEGAYEVETAYSFAELVTARRQVSVTDGQFEPETPTARDFSTVEFVEQADAESVSIVQSSEPNEPIVLSRSPAAMDERAVSEVELPVLPPVAQIPTATTPEKAVEPQDFNPHKRNKELTPLPLVEADKRLDEQVVAKTPSLPTKEGNGTNANTNDYLAANAPNLVATPDELPADGTALAQKNAPLLEHLPAFPSQNEKTEIEAVIKSPLALRESDQNDATAVVSPTVENTTVPEATVQAVSTTTEFATHMPQSQSGEGLTEEIDRSDENLTLDEAVSDVTSTAVGKLTELSAEIRQTDAQPTTPSQILNADDWLSAAQQSQPRPLNAVPTGELRMPVTSAEKVSRSGSLRVEKTDAPTVPPVLNRVPTSKLPFLEQLAAANARDAETPVNKGESANDASVVVEPKAETVETKAEAKPVAEAADVTPRAMTEEAAAVAPAKKYTVSRGGSSSRFSMHTLHEATRTESAANASAETNMAAAQMPAVNGTQVAQSGSAETEEALPVVQQLAQPLVTASEQLTPGEHKTLKLKLRPEELGQVEIEITRDAAGRLNAHFTVEHDQTQRVLREELGQLRTALEQAGWQVEQLAISTQQPHLGGQTGGQSAQQGATDSMPFSLPDQEPLNDTEPTSNGGLPTAQDRLLNLHA